MMQNIINHAGTSFCRIYAAVAELIIEEVLNSIIITFYNNEQEERLKAIIMAEGIFNNEMDMEIERWGEKIIKV